MRYGVDSVTFLLDHSRPLQPMVSARPARTAVGMSHHKRNVIACPKCITVKKYEKRKKRKAKRKFQNGCCGTGKEEGLTPG